MVLLEEAHIRDQTVLVKEGKFGENDARSDTSECKSSGGKNQIIYTQNQYGTYSIKLTVVVGNIQKLVIVRV